jgi:outer membrane protein TolC
VGLTQFLELAGAPGARRRAAELDADATAADIQAIERDLVAGLTLAFHAYAEAIERQKAQQSYTRELERIEQLVKTRVEGGMAPRYDATRMALALVDARSAILAARADTRRAHGALAIAVGSGIPPEGAETDVDFEATFEVSPVGLPGELAPTNPYLLAARRRTEAAGAAVSAAEKSVWPGLGLRLMGGFGQAPGQVDLGLGVIVPLPLLDRGQGSIQAAQARVDEVRAEQSAVERSLRQQLSAAQEELERRAGALEEFRRGTQALLAPLREQAEAGYKDGRLSAFELIEAYRSARDARLRQVELVVGVLTARTSLRRLSSARDPGGP